MPDIDFQVLPLPADRFEPLLGAGDAGLAGRGAAWLRVDAKPCYPCRVSLVDAEVGERVLALSFPHHDVDSPYRASGPIFVREHAAAARPRVNEVPALLRCRTLSARAYDAAHTMVSAAVAEGAGLETAIAALFKNPSVSYIHLHNAGAGCYLCAVVRA